MTEEKAKSPTRVDPNIIIHVDLQITRLYPPTTLAACAHYNPSLGINCVGRVYDMQMAAAFQFYKLGQTTVRCPYCNVISARIEPVVGEIKMEGDQGQKKVVFGH